MAKITLANEDQVIKLFDIHTYATKKLAEHGLSDWTVVWDRSKVRGGQCRYGPREIGLSAYLLVLWEWDHIENTVLHEIAHALTKGHGHDNIWRAKFLAIGGNGKTRWGTDGEAHVEGKWIGECPNGHKVYKQRRSKAMTQRISCGRCSPSFDARYLLKWRENK